MDLSSLAQDPFFTQCKTFFAVVGTLYLIKVALGLLASLASGFCAYVLGPRLGLFGINVKKLGRWAVVTGASEGIGKHYALELARRGMNVVLMSRSREKLEKVAQDIKDDYSKETLVMPVDFAQGQAVYPALAKQLRDLDIGVLVNNVGLSHQYAQFLLEAPTQRLRDMVELNCQTMVQMTHLLLQGMVGRKRGAIINLSSFSSLQPTPLISVYSATKIFVTHFSDALGKEYQSKGIIVQNVTPFFISTAMTKMRPSYFVPSAVQYVKSAVPTLGIQSSTFGCFSHALIGFMFQFVPKFLSEKIFWNILIYGRKRYFAIMEKRKNKE